MSCNNLVIVESISLTAGHRHCDNSLGPIQAGQPLRIVIQTSSMLHSDMHRHGFSVLLAMAASNDAYCQFCNASGGVDPDAPAFRCGICERHAGRSLSLHSFPWPMAGDYFSKWTAALRPAGYPLSGRPRIRACRSENWRHRQHIDAYAYARQAPSTSAAVLPATLQPLLHCTLH